MLNDWAIANQTYDFVFMARPERVRELLMLPRPYLLQSSDDHNERHRNNATLVTLPRTWNVVALLVKHLESIHSPAVEEVALNYGPWETRLSEDHEADDCHGHLHIILTEEFVAYITQTQISAFSALYNRTGPPKDYSYEDCKELQTHRLLLERFQSLSDQVASLQNEVTSGFSELKALLTELLHSPSQFQLPSPRTNQCGAS